MSDHDYTPELVPLDAYGPDALDDTTLAAAPPPKPAGSRIPPHNLDAERALLGACLYSRRAIDDTLGTIGPADFYKPTHGHIWHAIATLTADGQPVDHLTVADQLERTGHLDRPDQRAELVALVADTPASSNAARYAQVIADHAAMRHLIAAGNDIAQLGWDTPDDVPAALDRAHRLLAAIEDPDPAGAVPLAGTLDDHAALIAARQSGTVPQGIPSGLAALDEIIGGFRPGQLVTICGRTSMGKTAVAGQLVLNADTAGHATLVASIEMGLEELTDRWISTVAQVKTNDLRHGTLSPRDVERVADGLDRLTATRIHVLDEPAATVASIRAAARKVPNLGLLVVDYLQLLTPTQRRDNRQVEVSEISGALKRLARDLDVPVLSLAQLNRGVEARADKRPMLADLRESGAIEQDSDIVLGLYRDEYYHPDSVDRGLMEIIVLKQRSGATGTAKVAYRAATGEIVTMAAGV